MDMNNVFGFDKVGFTTDREIEELYSRKSELTDDKDIQAKLLRASLYDPRKSDIYFETEEAASKAEQIAHKLNEMTTDEFMQDNYPAEWLQELQGASIYKIPNPSVLKSY
jgi:hypothetical protein